MSIKDIINFNTEHTPLNKKWRGENEPWCGEPVHWLDSKWHLTLKRKMSSGYDYDKDSLYKRTVIEAVYG